MREALALRILGEVMAQWSDSHAGEEFAWLRLIARLKYDGYQGFLAGVRFLESLIIWLQQFEPEDREVAYNMVRKRLAFISTAEINRLVERFYRTELQPNLVRDAATAHCVEPYLVWADCQTRSTIRKLRRQTLIVGLSDGARTDVLRRANVGIFSNEQIVLAPLMDDDKWLALGKELRDDPLFKGSNNPKFTRVYLIDDLTASGTTLIRRKSGGEWIGKLPRFRKAICDASLRLKDDFPLAETVRVCVHHYIATEGATRATGDRCQLAAQHLKDEWYRNIQLTVGMILPDTFRLSPDFDGGFIGLADRYYDGKALEDKHTKESGIDHMKYGYAGCCLPLILEHNTPNNAISLLWADTPGGDGVHRMRPLFRRRTRHY